MRLGKIIAWVDAWFGNNKWKYSERCGCMGILVAFCSGVLLQNKEGKPRTLTMCFLVFSDSVEVTLSWSSLPLFLPMNKPCWQHQTLQGALLLAFWLGGTDSLPVPGIASFRSCWYSSFQSSAVSKDFLTFHFLIAGKTKAIPQKGGCKGQRKVNHAQETALKGTTGNNLRSWKSCSA